MRIVPNVAIAATVFFAAAAHAAQITATIAVPTEPGEVLVRAHRLDGRADDVEQRIQVPGVNTLQLHEGVWELRLDNGNFWAPLVYARDSDSVTLPVWPAVPLRGTANGLTKLAVSFTPVDHGGAAGQTECSMDDIAWICMIPPGHYDLRFSTPGSAPEFRWNVTAPGKSGAPLQFVRGASLSGRLEAVRGARISLDGLEVLLSGAQQRYTAKSNAKGFFQFKGLPAGQYSVRAQQEGLATAARPVTIFEASAVELNAPLLLDRPKRLTVTIAPTLDPELKPWRVSVWAYGEGHRGLTGVSESAATPTGEWSLSGLIAGDYEVQIARANGGVWKSVDVTIGDTDVALPQTVFGESIRGVITLGERPLVAKLSFGGENGATLISDDNGHFEGEIPPDKSDERAIYVDAEAARVARTIRAKLDRTESGTRIVIKLPATLLTGRVIGAGGAPRRDALITVSGDGPGAVHQLFSESDGSFQLTGMDAGEYRVRAEDRDERSEPVTVRLADDDSPAEVELVLKNSVIVEGVVRSAVTPVVLADVYGIPRDTPFPPLLPQAKTNEGGRFELKLPPRTMIVDLVMIHPAFDIVMTRLAGQIDSVRHIVATQLGGTLTVDAPTPQDILLRHGGGECWLSWLAHVARANAVVESSRIVLQRLEPGEYSVCSARINECAHGYLPPYGALTLRIGPEHHPDAPTSEKSSTP